ncbi:MAG: triose-phosphate isomerase [Thaumarchaeota archaeon]|nr:triose-phosphate isomerase [Nitrososphaerota archaeon]
MFIINYKNYDEIAGVKSAKLASVADKISKKFKVKIAIAPPHHLLGVKYSGPILAQHTDNVKVGNTTGFVIPELLKKSKIAGSLINHSEHRIPPKNIEELVNRFRELGLVSVVCVQDAKEAARYAKLNPDYIAIEPPELIGSGKAVSTEQPELITKSVQAVNNAKNSTKLLCGAGIVSGQDVRKAIELGSSGILVASGIVKAKNWSAIVEEFAKAMLKTPSNR